MWSLQSMKKIYIITMLSAKAGLLNQVNFKFLLVVHQETFF